MFSDAQKIRETLDALSPQERADVESLVLEKVIRDANARDEARDPERYRLAEEHARIVAAALLANPLPPGAEEKIRTAWTAVARDLLEGRTP